MKMVINTYFSYILLCIPFIRNVGAHVIPTIYTPALLKYSDSGSDSH